MAIASLAAVLAGCASSAGPQEPPGSAPAVEAAAPPQEAAPPARAQPVVWSALHEGRITGAGAGLVLAGNSLCCLSLHHQGEEIRGAFPVAASASRIVVELAWDDPLVDLDLHLAAPDYRYFFPPDVDLAESRLRDSDGTSAYNRNGTLAQPDGVARIEVVDPEALQLAGDWAWDVRSKTSYETEFRLNVTVEYAHHEEPV